MKEAVGPRQHEARRSQSGDTVTLVPKEGNYSRVFALIFDATSPSSPPRKHTRYFEKPQHLELQDNKSIMQLLDMPLEVIEMILSCIAITQRDRCALARVNKSLNAKVTSILYRVVLFSGSYRELLSGCYIYL